MRSVSCVDWNRRALIQHGGAHSCSARAGAHVSIWNRTRARAEQLANEFSAIACDNLSAPVDLIVNTTPVCMPPHADESPIALPDCLDSTIVYDLVYHPRETKLLRDA